MGNVVYFQSSSYLEAAECARKINSFWRKLGCNAGAVVVPRKATPEEVEQDTRPSAWVIKSNLVNGLPRGKKWKMQDLLKINELVDSIDLTKLSA